MNNSSLRRLPRAVLLAAVAAIAAPMPSGMAADDGIGAFFRNVFGGGQAVEPSWSGSYDERPIIVRPRHSRAASHRPAVKVAVGPVPRISIYDDKTLRPGDAVMTSKGLRVFVGARALPYSESDFATVADADHLSKTVERQLVAIDKAPRS